VIQVDNLPAKLREADLGRIIGERLARERAKAEPSPEDAREADLRARETRAFDSYKSKKRLKSIGNTRKI